MRSFAGLARSSKLIEVLRWLCVLPAAVLGAFAMQSIVRGVVQIADYGGWAILGDSTIAYFLRLFLFYVLREFVLVVVGAMMAPRYQMATAIALTLLAIALSLMVHIVGQHLVGNHVGRVNYTHFSAESVGALAGAACIFLSSWTRRNLPMAL